MKFLLWQEVSMAQKPSIPKGTRDFNPEQVAKRNYIFNVIKTNFERFGFQPIETPSFENSDTLMGKYGEEGDRLIFKILDSGDYFGKFSSTLSKYFSMFFYNFLTNPSNDLEIIFQNFKKENINFNTEILQEIGKDFEREINDIDAIDNYFFNVAFNVIKRDLKEFAVFKFNNKANDIDFASDLAEFNLNKGLEAFSIWSLGIKSNKISKYISEKALRYDLTVPFARYVVQHQNEIEFPFKRYQIQPVWRADRPQKGRFREFYQCDADVVGSKSLLQEVAFIQLYDAVFTNLKLEGVTIKINNRKILSGIAEVIGASDKLIDFTVALDKLDKIGEEKVKEEMLAKGISQSGINKLQPLFNLKGNFESQIESLKEILNISEEGKKGIEELEFIDKTINQLQLETAKLQLDVTLARGLNYYTGAIFEVSAPENVQLGSIGGGGRYDDLTGIFGMKDVSGVGISFGLDRIYLVLEELNLFPETVSKSIDVLFINFGNAEAVFCLKAIKELRKQGINTELYPDAAKMKKQMNHANKRNIPFVVLVGEEEIKSNLYTLKHMQSGEQLKLSLADLITNIK